MRLANFKRVQFAVIGLTNDSETAKILAPPFVNNEERYGNFERWHNLLGLSAAKSQSEFMPWLANAAFLS